MLAFGSDWIFYDQLDEMRNDSRAWVGPVDATVKSPLQLGQGINGTIVYNNTGKSPATKFFDTERIMTYSADDWNSGKATQDIINYKEACFSSEYSAASRVVFPTTGFTGYTMYFDTVENALKKADAVRVSQEILDGHTYFVIMGCFLYVSNSANRHTSFCFSYQNGKTDPSHMNICTVGHDAD